jgi:MtN3 and saliva related transmembrane protein
MLLETVFGVAAGIVTSVRLFPQVYKTVKMKKADDISFWFLILLVSQTLLLMGYGLTKADVYIVFMNIVPLICSCVLLNLKHVYSIHAKTFSYESRSYRIHFFLRQKLNAKTPHLKKVFFIHKYISK